MIIIVPYWVRKNFNFLLCLKEKVVAAAIISELNYTKKSWTWEGRYENAYLNYLQELLTLKG